MTPQGPSPASRPRAPRPPRPAWVAARRPRARPPVAAPRAPRPATRCRPASRAGRCRCTCGCPSCGASRTRSAPSTRSSTWTSSAALFPEGGEVTVDDLVAKGAVRKGQLVKVLGTGRDRRSRCRSARTPFSASAKDKIAAAGGTRHRALSQLGPSIDHRSPGRLARAPGSGRCPVRVRCGPASRPAQLAARSRAGTHRERPQEDLVLTAFARAFRTPDLRKKLLFTLGIMALFRLGSVIPTPGVDYAAVQSCIDQRRRQRALQPDQPVQRRRAAAAVDLRARDHAVHHGEHHRAAAHRGDPAVRGAQEGGPVRHGEAHAVHALPDDRPGGPAVDRPHRAGPPARAAVPAAAPSDIISATSASSAS